MAETKKSTRTSKGVKEKQILIRGVNWLGDAVMTLPAITRLKEKFPDSVVTVLAPSKLSSLYSLSSSVSNVLSFDPSEGLFTVAGRLRKSSLELGIIFPNSPRSALELFLGGVPKRIGYSRRWRSLFLTSKVPPYDKEIAMRKRSRAEIKELISNPLYSRQHIPFSAHQIHHYLQLVAFLGCDSEPAPPRLNILGKSVFEFREKFGLEKIARFVGVNPGAEYGPAKRWPREKFIEAMKYVDLGVDVHWLLFGGSGDIDTCQMIKAQFPASSVTDLSGRTSLVELCAGLKVCDAVLTNDTGPMHLASAVGTPIVVPFGSTSPELTGPGWPPVKEGILKADVPCSPCFLKVCPIDFRCMQAISSRLVADKLLNILLLK